MEVKMVVSSQPPSLNLLNLNRNYTNCSTPYITAPSSPDQHPLNFFYSAPPSPRRFHRDNDFNDGCLPPPSTTTTAEEDDFEFQFNGELNPIIRPSLSSADELFDGGKIRALKPPPIISTVDCSDSNPKIPQIQSRGRSKNLPNSRTNSRKGISRSLSPLRISEFPQNPNRNPNSNEGSSSSRWSSRKWRLKDFLLFRSASEGTGKDRKKYFSLYSKKGDEGSFRSMTSSSSMADGGSVSRRRGQVSAHEMHYTANRAVTEEMKKKTSLPYKHGLLGCLGFNPVFHDISKAFGSFTRS